jgi:hypothetical protein
LTGHALARERTAIICRKKRKRKFHRYLAEAFLEWLSFELELFSKRSLIRHAPSFLPGNVLQGVEERPYTAQRPAQVAPPDHRTPSAAAY